VKSFGKWMLVLILVGISLLALALWPKNIEFVTDDGNVLFYNSPIVDSDGAKIFIAYLKKSGKVVVKSLDEKSWLNNLGIKSDADNHSNIEILIHDHSDLVNLAHGQTADDHATPSIIFIENTKELLIATAYHGTDLYIYALKNNQVKLKKKITGRYTYPRWLQLNGEILLFSRLQSKGRRNGHLVYRSSKDNFQIEKLAIKSEEGEVVYASAPKSAQDNHVYIQYSIHNYKENRLIVWQLIKLNPSDGRTLETCDLSHLLPKKYFSNRPTGISVRGTEFLVGTAYMMVEDWTLPAGNFNRVNVVSLVKGSLNAMCSSAEVVHEGIAKTPYYHTSVAISDSFDWLYFDDNKYVSNNKYTGCFSKDKFMYPFFYKNELFYAAQNTSYSIRNFSNSIFRCY